MTESNSNGARHRRDRIRDVPERFDDLVRRRRSRAVAVAVGAPLLLALAAVGYALLTDASRMLDLQLAGSAAEARAVVGDSGDEYVKAQYVDFGLIVAYVVALSVATRLGKATAATTSGEALFRAATWAALVAGLSDMLENGALLIAMRGSPDEYSTAWLVAAQAFAITKLAVLLPVAVAALLAVLAMLRLAIVTPRTEAARRRRFDPPMVNLPSDRDDKALASEDSDSPGVARAAWRANSSLPPGRRPAGPDSVGFCVSGGGVRSATFTLGALDSLRDELVGARYLVSVSGGGYATGAMKLALADSLAQASAPAAAGTNGVASGNGERRGSPSVVVSNPGSAALSDPVSVARPVARPKDVYRPGSPELNHTRNHANYLADRPVEWAAAIGVLLRGFLVNLVLLVVGAVTVGRVLGHAYSSLPEDWWNPSGAWESVWPPERGAAWAVGVLVLLYLLTWCVTVFVDQGRDAESEQFGWPRRLVMRPSIAVAALVAVVGVLLPVLAFVGAWLWSEGFAVGGASVLLGYLGTLAALSQRPAVRKSVGTVARLWSKSRPQQRAVATTVLVWLSLAVMVVGLLLTFAVALGTTDGSEGWAYTLAGAVVVALIALIDQVRWSLHPFYRLRLASAFAVRRTREGGRVGAKAYAANTFTWLDRYAKCPPAESSAAGDGFPQVIFSCAAHISDSGLTPPGRKVVAWSMSGDYVGGPTIGWVRSDRLRQATPKVIRRDLTVEAAQAISGAAIASQMGTQGRVYSRLLTLTNARLGSWLPNPTFLAKLRGDDEQHWWQQTLPSRRSLGTLGREFFGAFPSDAPLVYVTDGGHYDNLGLVELLRHRCTYVYCLDASGGRSSVPSALASAVALAYEELGVTIELNKPGRLGAGPLWPRPRPADELAGELGERLAQGCVTVGTITYPDLGPGLAAKRGLLVVGKAALTRDSPFEVLAYATGRPGFPNDSTADQWFDYTQFDAYHALGRHVGKQAANAMASLRRSGAQTSAGSLRNPLSVT